MVDNAGLQRLWNVKTSRAVIEDMRRAGSNDTLGFPPDAWTLAEAMRSLRFVQGLAIGVSKLDFETMTDALADRELAAVVTGVAVCGRKNLVAPKRIESVCNVVLAWKRGVSRVSSG